MNAKSEIMMELKRGKSITPLEALRKYGTFRLSSIIHRLRQEGFPIETKMVDEKGKIFAEYSL